ncbi:MAG TPA: phytanoyl-CoA dioxygenase family protein [Phenylobacterium sp.]|nr:phytanoyl-CoA dioxygenase family protein [Phenylobacterium sp.]
MTASLPPLRTDLERAAEDLAEVGVTRVLGAADPGEIELAARRLADQAAAEVKLGVAFHDDGLTLQANPRAPNQRVWNLINKGEVFRRLALNEVARGLVARLLGPDALLFSMTANIACKGGKAQALHGDQVFAPAETPYPLVANCLWMLDAFTPDNGATRVAPGTHMARRWPSWNESVETFPAIGPKGALMVWDGRLWHGTGANRTEAPRRGLLAAYCAPFVRQQENATLSTSPGTLKDCSDELLALLGFRSWAGMGSIDGADNGVLRGRPTSYSGELSPGT